jgi:hypothetical protein
MDSNSVSIITATTDWGFVTILIQIIVSVTTCVAMVLTAVVAIYGITSWRREFRGKRDIELAEEVLELFYRAQDAIRAIRSPLGFQSEGKKVIERWKAEGIESNISMRAAVLTERFEEREEVFQKLHALRYRFAARFGKDKVKPFDGIKESVDKMFISANMLSMLQESRSYGEKTGNKKREYEADLTWADKEKDKITPMVEAAVKQIEGTCWEIIDSR